MAHSDRLPPLHAVHVFVAVARALSMSRAAQELSVTHGAVSRQVRLLEEHLGQPLFERRVRQLALTAAGRRLLAEAGPALERIAVAAGALRRPQDTTQRVRVNVRASFAQRWLIPRLPGFVAQHPGITPAVLTTSRAPEKQLGRFDVAVQRGLSGWPAAIEPVPFLWDDLALVAAPTLLQERPVRGPEDLADHVLLEAKTRPDDWRAWFAQVGAPGLRGRGLLTFDHHYLVLQAAVDGLGVALAPDSLAGSDLARGQLAAPLPLMRLAAAPYYLGLAPQADAAAQALACWLRAQGQAGVPGAAGP
ncbi:MAG TPA: LysR substrate-binding domain-containing protein [Burkholderiaceae bacterium]